MSNFNPFNEYDPYFYSPEHYKSTKIKNYTDPLLRLQASALTDGWGYGIPTIYF